MSTRAGFEALYREHYVQVFNLCRKLLVSHSQAEDAAQETFMRAYRKLKSYDASRPFSSWVMSIANNHCIDLLRRRSKEIDLFGDQADDFETVPGTDRDSLAGLVRQENVTDINKALDRLPHKYRVPLVLFYYSDYSYEEIAGILNIGRNYVGVLILRGKQMIRQEYDNLSLGSSPQHSMETGAS